MNTIAPCVESLGHLSCRLGVGVGKIVKAMHVLSIEPALTLDDVQHVDEDSADRIAEHIAKAREGKGR